MSVDFEFAVKKTAFEVLIELKPLGFTLSAKIAEKMLDVWQLPNDIPIEVFSSLQLVHTLEVNCYLRRLLYKDSENNEV